MLSCGKVSDVIKYLHLPVGEMLEVKAKVEFWAKSKKKKSNKDKDNNNNNNNNNKNASQQTRSRGSS